MSMFDESSYELICQKEYGVSDKIFDTWMETYLLLSTFGMIDLNQTWFNQPLYECWRHFRKTPYKTGQLLIKLTCKNDLSYIDLYDKMLSSKQGQNYFIENKIPDEIINDINKIMKKEVFVMYLASLYINDATNRNLLLSKSEKYKLLTLEQKASIKYLNELYTKNPHPLIALLLFCQYDMKDIIIIGL